MGNQGRQGATERCLSVSTTAVSSVPIRENYYFLDRNCAALSSALQYAMYRAEIGL